MNETSKTRKLWNERHFRILSGNGIDIGGGKDPVAPNTRIFDLEQGDANHITRYINEQFDFVYSSHCLEHMRSELVEIQLQDINYDRSLLKFGQKYPTATKVGELLQKYYWWLHSHTNIRWRWLESKYNTIDMMINMVDQTFRTDALAQIQCIVRKREL